MGHQEGCSSGLLDHGLANPTEEAVLAAGLISTVSLYDFWSISIDFVHLGPAVIKSTAGAASLRKGQFSRSRLSRLDLDLEICFPPGFVAAPAARK